MKYLFLIFALSTCNLYVSAQSVEKRISKREIPIQILDYLKINYPQTINYKFYQQSQGDSLLYEADFKSNKQFYSLLFDKNGKLYELEIKIDFDEIEQILQEKITMFLKTKFEKYRILKSQSVVIEHIKFFEFEIKGKSKTRTQRGYYEFYFDSQGNFLKALDIQLNAIVTLF